MTPAPPDVPDGLKEVAYAIDNATDQFERIADKLNDALLDDDGRPIESVASALRAVFISPNCSDTNGEPANVVDGLFYMARAIDRLGKAVEAAGPAAPDDKKSVEPPMTKPREHGILSWKDGERQRRAQMAKSPAAND